jgi:hypothetical protein
LGFLQATTIRAASASYPDRNKAFISEPLGEVATDHLLLLHLIRIRVGLVVRYALSELIGEYLEDHS